MKRTLTAVVAIGALYSCASDPNEGVFVINGVTMPKLSESRLVEIRKTWSPASQPKSEGTKAGRLAAYWILDLIAHTEIPPGSACTRLDLVGIRPREVDLTFPRRSPTGETYFFRAMTYHEAWIVDVCGQLHEWRVLDDAANPQNPMRVLPWGAA